MEESTSKTCPPYVGYRTCICPTKITIILRFYFLFVWVAPWMHVCVPWETLLIKVEVSHWLSGAQHIWRTKSCTLHTEKWGNVWCEVSTWPAELPSLRQIEQQLSDPVLTLHTKERKALGLSYIINSMWRTFAKTITFRQIIAKLSVLGCLKKSTTLETEGSTTTFHL